MFLWKIPWFTPTKKEERQQRVDMSAKIAAELNQRGAKFEGNLRNITALLYELEKTFDDKQRKLYDEIRKEQAQADVHKTMYDIALKASNERLYL